MRKIDYIISALYAIIMVLLYLIGFCHWDIWVLLLGAIVLLVACIIWSRQGHKSNKLSDEIEDLEEQKESYTTQA